MLGLTWNRIDQIKSQTQKSFAWTYLSSYHVECIFIGLKHIAYTSNYDRQLKLLKLFLFGMKDFILLLMLSRISF